MRQRAEAAVREAVGLLRATARGDEDAAAFVASNLTDAALTAGTIAMWFAGAVRNVAEGIGDDPDVAVHALVEAIAEDVG